MANINAPEVEYFESFANEIASKFQRVKNLVSHSVASGDYHEEVIRNVLRNFLTKRYSVKKGFIYKGKSEVSNQIDIMIVDENSPAAYLFQEGDFAIVIPEAVIAVIEVKTTLTASEFDIALDNITSAKRLFQFPAVVPGIVFSYQGTSPSDENLDTWFKRQGPAKYKDHLALAPNAIMFFTEGCLLTRYSEEGRFDAAGKYYRKIFRDDSVKQEPNDFGWQLSIILAMIINSCGWAETRRTGRLDEGVADRLVQAEGGMLSNSRFSFGEGMSVQS